MHNSEKMLYDDHYRRASYVWMLLYSVLLCVFAWGAPLAGWGLPLEEWEQIRRYPPSFMILGLAGTLPAVLFASHILNELRERRDSQRINAADEIAETTEEESPPLEPIAFQIPTPEQRAKLHRLMMESDRYGRWTGNQNRVGFGMMAGQAGMLVGFATLNVLILLPALIAMVGFLPCSIVALYAAIQHQRRNKALAAYFAEILKVAPHPCHVGNALHYLRSGDEKARLEAYNIIANILYSMDAESMELHLHDHKAVLKSLLRSACKPRKAFSPNLIRALLHIAGKMEETSLLPVVRYVANRGATRQIRREAKDVALQLEAAYNAANTAETLLRPAYALPAGELLRPVYASQETQESQKLLLKPAASPRKDDSQ